MSGRYLTDLSSQAKMFEYPEYEFFSFLFAEQIIEGGLI